MSKKENQHQDEGQGVDPVPEQKAPKATKAETAITTVTMTDGRVVDFPGKRRQLKSTTIGEDGSVTIHLDYANGECRQYKMHPALLARFAAHGMEQKYGDKFTDEADIDDAINGVDDMHERLSRGEWTAAERKGGNAGGSILARALVELSGKTPEAIRAFLSTKTPEYKLALRKSKDLAPIVQRLEAEKAAKAKGSKPEVAAAVDTDLMDLLS